MLQFSLRRWWRSSTAILTPLPPIPAMRQIIGYCLMKWYGSQAK